MQAVEALTRLIAIADQANQVTSFDMKTTEELEQDQLAVTIAQAMLNTALPVARFRCFVRIEGGVKKEIGSEYTVCAPDLKSIQSSLRLLLPHRRDVYIQLWEQRKTGADMLSAYQGSTRYGVRGNQRVHNFDLWITGLAKVVPKEETVQ